MVSKTVVVALAVLLVAAGATFLGVFFGADLRRFPEEPFFSRAAVASDAGPCSEIGRLAQFQHSHIPIKPFQLISRLNLLVYIHSTSHNLMTFMLYFNILLTFKYTLPCHVKPQRHAEEGRFCGGRHDSHPAVRGPHERSQCRYRRGAINNHLQRNDR